MTEAQESYGEDDVIRFKAQVWSIKTLVDGGMNVTLALSDKEIEQVSQLLECKRNGALLEVAAIPVVTEVMQEQVKDESRRKRTERYPYRTKS